MTQASVGERVYREIKRRLLAGEFAPGERLDINALGHALAASITPVRSALSRLVGEELLEAHARDGFHRPFVSELGLRDLYAWNALEVAQAIAIASDNRILRAITNSDDDADRELLDPVARTEGLFNAIASSSRNVVCERIVAWLNDQLHAMRHVEPIALSDTEAELKELESCYAAGRFKDLAAAVEAYHERRRASVAEIISAVHRPDLGRSGATD